MIAAYDSQGNLNRDRALTAEWSSIDLLFQLSGTDLTLTETTGWLFDPSQTQVDNTIIQSYLFFALRLEGSNYNRTQLAQITREINKLFMMPAMLLFQHGETLTLSIINRRLHAADPSRDVLEKVIRIKIESSENRTHLWSGQVAAKAEQIFAAAYPAIHAHFESFREQLINRYDQGKYFWELRTCAY